MATFKIKAIGVGRDHQITRAETTIDDSILLKSDPPQFYINKEAYFAKVVNGEFP